MQYVEMECVADIIRDKRLPAALIVCAGSCVKDRPLTTHSANFSSGDQLEELLREYWRKSGDKADSVASRVTPLFCLLHLPVLQGHPVMIHSVGFLRRSHSSELPRS